MGEHVDACISSGIILNKSAILMPVEEEGLLISV